MIPNARLKADATRRADFKSQREDQTAHGQSSRTSVKLGRNPGHGRARHRHRDVLRPAGLLHPHGRGPLPVSGPGPRHPQGLRLFPRQYRTALHNFHSGPGNRRPADRLPARALLAKNGSADGHRYFFLGHGAHHAGPRILDHARLPRGARHRHVHAGHVHVRAGRQLFFRVSLRGHRLRQFLLRHRRISRAVSGRKTSPVLQHLARADAFVRRCLVS